MIDLWCPFASQISYKSSPWSVTKSHATLVNVVCVRLPDSFTHDRQTSVFTLPPGNQMPRESTSAMSKVASLMAADIDSSCRQEQFII